MFLPQQSPPQKLHKKAAWLHIRITPNQTKLQGKGRKKPFSQSGSSQNLQIKNKGITEKNMQVIAAEKLNWPPSELLQDMTLKL